MRFEFQNSWLRLLIELWPRVLPIRRYRVANDDVAPARRRMVCHIYRQLRHTTDS